MIKGEKENHALKLSNKRRLNASGTQLASPNLPPRYSKFHYEIKKIRNKCLRSAMLV